MSNSPWYSSDRLTRRGHALLAAGFVAVGVYYWAACRPSGFQGGDVIDVATMVEKDLDPSLFARDFTYATRKYSGTYVPCFRFGLGVLSRVVGGTLNAHKALVLCAVPAYLVAMFLLLNELTRNWLVSATTAVMSLTLRGSIHLGWGMGALSATQARTLYLAVFAAAFYLLVRARHRPRLRLLLFLMVGFSFNLHPVAAASCLLAVSFSLLYSHGLTAANFRRLAIFVGIFAVFALPSGIPYLQALFGEKVRGLDTALVNEILRYRLAYRFLDTGSLGLSNIGGWLWASTLLGIGAKAWVRGLDERDGALLAAGIGMMAVSLLGTALLTRLCDLLGRPKLVSFTLRWARFVFLIHYVFMAQLLASLFEIARSAGKPWLSLGAKAAAALLIGVQAIDAGAFASRVWRVGHEEASGADVALLDVAAWARENTGRDALFHFNDRRFRLEALRGLTVCWKDGGHFVQADPRKLREWWRRLESHNEAMAKRSSAQALKLALEYGADYLVLPRKFRRMAQPVAHENSHFVVYRLLRSPDPAT